MKKIIRTIDITEVTHIADITNNSIVAIKWSDSAVSIVIRAKDEWFCGLSYNNFDLRSAWSRSSKKEYVESALNQKGAKAFEFNSYKELYEWLAIQ